MDGGEDAVQGVAEFVKQGSDLVEGKQRGFARRRARDIEVIADEGAGAQQA